MPQFINGPTNFIQLKGTINNIEKNIYLFADRHNSLDNQTRCDSFDSLDISQYLYQLIKNTTIPLDFFLEVIVVDDGSTDKTFQVLSQLTINNLPACGRQAINN